MYNKSDDNLDIFKKDLKNLIENIKKATGKSQEEISLGANYKAKTLTQILSQKKINDTVIPQLHFVYKEDLQRLEKSTYLNERRDKKLNTEAKRIPLYDAPALGGLTETDMTPIHAPAGTIDVGDLLHDSEAAIRIYGNSMLPGYPPGCVVGLNKVTTNFIEPGEIYVIETIDRRILKRLFYFNDDPQSESILCISDNTMLFEGGARHGKLAYPPFAIPKTEIKQLFVVTGVIKRNSNSVIINRAVK